jgi:hypothetical protein
MTSVLFDEYEDNADEQQLDNLSQFSVSMRQPKQVIPTDLDAESVASMLITNDQ